MDLVKVLVYHSLTNLTIIADEHIDGCVHEVRFGITDNHERKNVRESNGMLLKAKTEKAFREFFEGKANAFAEIKIDLTGKTLFQKRVLEAAQRIPWGTVVSYSELAAMAGYPRAIRAVASVMRNNHVPLIVPCHRVIAKNGKLGGFMGNLTGTAIDLKARLLSNEGMRL